MPDSNTSEDLQTVINSLLECETKNRKCRRCKMRKRECLLFLRDSIAVALQFIHAGLPVSEEPPEGLYQ